MLGIMSKRQKEILKNIMKVELALESMKLPFMKKGNAFIVFDNKYRNQDRDFTKLYIIVTQNGAQFKDARERKITYLGEDITSPENVSNQLLNIFGLVTRRLLVTK